MATIGRTDIGSNNTITNYVHRAPWASAYVYTPGAGTIDNAQVYCYITALDGTNQVRVHIWEKGSTVDLTTLVASSDITDITNTSAAWITCTMSGTLEAGKDYIISYQGYNSTDTNLRVYSDTITWGDVKILTDTDLVAPSDLTGAADSNRDYGSVYINYTASSSGVTATMAPATCVVSTNSMTAESGSISVSMGTITSVVSTNSMTAISGDSSATMATGTVVVSTSGMTAILGDSSASMASATCIVATSGMTVTIGSGNVTATLSSATCVVSTNNISALSGSTSASLTKAICVVSTNGMTIVLGSATAGMGTITCVVSTSGMTIVAGFVSLADEARTAVYDLLSNHAYINEVNTGLATKGRNAVHTILSTNVIGT